MSGKQDQKNADRAHEDAIAINPFTLTNALLAIGLVVFTALFSQAIASVQDFVKSTKAAEEQTHDALLSHGFMLTNMQRDIDQLKAACMTKDRVDDEIRAHGGWRTGLPPFFDPTDLATVTTNLNFKQWASKSRLR